LTTIGRIHAQDVVVQKSQMEHDNKKVESSSVKKNNSSVQFSGLVTIHTLDDEEEDRRSEWMRHAVDTQHFKHRIARLAPIVERVRFEHRRKIRHRYRL